VDDRQWHAHDQRPHAARRARAGRQRITQLHGVSACRSGPAGPPAGRTRFTPRSFVMRGTRSLVLVALTAAVLTACGSASAKHDPGPAPKAETPAASPVTMQPVDGIVATTHGGIAVYDAASVSATAHLLAARTSFGSPTTMLVQAWEGAHGN